MPILRRYRSSDREAVWELHRLALRETGRRKVQYLDVIDYEKELKGE